MKTSPNGLLNITAKLSQLDLLKKEIQMIENHEELKDKSFSKSLLKYLYEDLEKLSQSS